MVEEVEAMVAELINMQEDGGNKALNQKRLKEEVATIKRKLEEEEEKEELAELIKTREAELAELMNMPEGEDKDQQLKGLEEKEEIIRRNLEKKEKKDIALGITFCLTNVIKENIINALEQAKENVEKKLMSLR